MRVAIVQEEIDFQRGGAETSTLEMAQHLGQLGLDVTLAHRDARGKGEILWVGSNVSCVPLAAPGRTRIGRTYRFVQAVQQLCRTQRFDIVHAVTPCLAANVYQPRGGTYAEAVARATAMHPPWLRTLKRFGRRFNVRQRFLMRLEATLLHKHAGRVVVAAVSEYVRRQILAAGFPAERVRVVFNGVDISPLDAQARTTVRAELGWPETLPLVLFVAHNFKLKGLRELLYALAASRSDWTVAVAGRDDSRPYERLARRLGVDRRVRFVGSDRPVQLWYVVADALAHPTWYDPCSRVVLEALCLGLPVVTTRYNGAAEVMETGRHGVVIDEPDDAAALAAGIECVLHHPIRSACRADAARMRARLSMARHARELAALYEDVLSQRFATRSSGKEGNI